MLKTLKEGLPQLGLDLSEDICIQLCDFVKAMVKQNEVMNLTGITEDTAGSPWLPGRQLPTAHREIPHRSPHR